MKTDNQLGALFHSNPKMLAELLSLTYSEDHTATSQEFKEIKRTADIVWRSAKDNEQTIVEFQGYYDEAIFHRAEIQRVMLSIEDVCKTVRLVIVFLDPKYNPQTQPWKGYIEAGNPLYEVVYLEEALKELNAKQLNHPLVLTLSPIYLKDKQSVIELALKKIHAHSGEQVVSGRKAILEQYFPEFVFVTFWNPKIGGPDSNDTYDEFDRSFERHFGW